jgi:hypothetical protein
LGVLGTQETFCIVIAGLFEKDSFDLFLPEFDKPWVIHLRETCCCCTNLCTWRPNTVYKNRRVHRHHQALARREVLKEQFQNQARWRRRGIRLWFRSCRFLELVSASHRYQQHHLGFLQGRRSWLGLGRTFSAKATSAQRISIALHLLPQSSGSRSTLTLGFWRCQRVATEEGAGEEVREEGAQKVTNLPTHCSLATAAEFHFA